MKCCFKIYFYEPQVLRNESLAVMVLPGFARKEHESKERQIPRHTQCFSISAVGKECLYAFVSEGKSSNYWQGVSEADPTGSSYEADCLCCQMEERKQHIHKVPVKCNAQ